MRILVYGLGYVGLSLACYLARGHDVLGADIDSAKLALLEKGISPIASPLLEASLKEHPFRVSKEPGMELSEADFIFFALPTNYQEEKKGFDVSLLREKLIGAFLKNPGAILVIKSTVPVGFCHQIKEEYPSMRLLFNPEFLREASCYEDMLSPSRIVIGEDSGLEKEGKALESLLLGLCQNKETPFLHTGYQEAEAIKLFSNAYLALRVAYFNELDTYALSKGLDAKTMIEGVCLDPRIQPQYNNPSFGYGGYCLPKDSKQLLEDYRDIPENLVKAIVESNDTRKKAIVSAILEKASGGSVGIYRLGLSQNASHIENSPVLDVIDLLVGQGANVVVYEPLLEGETVHGVPLVSFEELKKCSLIAANRYDESLAYVKGKVFSRDLFFRD